MKKLFKYSLISISSLIVLITAGYFIFIYEKPVNQADLNKFLKGQPVIDMHIHITKGYENNGFYGEGLPEGPELDQAKLDWMRKELDRNNIVLALGGGPVYHALRWGKADDRFWVGPVFPFNPLSPMDEPFEKEFLTYDELYQLYSTKSFRSMGEAMYVHKGVHPHDPRLEPYWRIASEFNIPIGIHSDVGPPKFMRNEGLRELHKEEYSNPELLRPILKKYPNLKIYLMHFSGQYSDEAIQLMKDYDQIYCEISATSLFAPKIFWEGKVKRLYEEGLGDRLMFASDYTGQIREHIEVIFSLDWLSENQKRDIMYNTAARFLGLSDEQVKKHYSMVK